MSRDKLRSRTDDEVNVASSRVTSRPSMDQDVLKQIAALKYAGTRGRKAPPRRPAVVDNGD